MTWTWPGAWTGWSMMIRVQSRKAIVPVFRIPLSVGSQEEEAAAVRHLFRLVGPEGVEPLTFPGLPFSLVGPEAGIDMRQTRCRRQGTPRRVPRQLANNALPNLEVISAQG
jgi:hypothetical protein